MPGAPVRSFSQHRPPRLKQTLASCAPRAMDAGVLARSGGDRPHPVRMKTEDAPTTSAPSPTSCSAKSSHPPTKDGARTRIASRWRDLWLSAPLNLDCRELTAGRYEVRSDVVSRILSSHGGPGPRLYVHTHIHRIPADTVEACLRPPLWTTSRSLISSNYRSEQPQRALTSAFSPTLRVANIGGCNLSDVNFHELNLHFPLA
ncbi:hypothetical protein D1007_07519 [Hordeum vulgare]|nr:hypothetical protein D1007_07519 [Hordeum vulgare]